MIALSHYQAKIILNFFERKFSEAEVSLDLGISNARIKFSDGKVFFPDGQSISIEDVKEITKNENVCFVVEENIVKKIHFFSEKTNQFYKLLPTGFSTAPTVEISGIRMHAVKDIEPMADAKEKIDSIKPFSGNILDTCSGLGYTAILSSEYGEVFTHEADENIIRMEKYNPWSRKLFTIKNIHRVHASILDKIGSFKDGFFDAIIHDPPSFKIAGELYTRDFYKELFRVLKKEGRMYHYIGSPGKRNRNVNIEKGILKRLEECGFSFLERAAKGIVVGK